MAPPIDYGSTLAFIIFMHELALLAVFLIRVVKPARPESAETQSNDAEAAALDPVVSNDDKLDDDTRFLYDLVVRGDEGIVQNIDALDNGLIAVAVGIIAVGLFVGDKWFDLEPAFRFTSLVLLVESAIVSVLGYLSRYVARTAASELVRVTELVVDFALSPTDATQRAIAAFTESVEANQRMRLMKCISSSRRRRLSSWRQRLPSSDVQSATFPFARRHAPKGGTIRQCHSGSGSSARGWPNSRESRSSDLVKHVR